ncbi:ribonuclease J [candidate division WWE3 bacterium]|uniref:Ribonuclease J n=1 Tax=candidate division WWE3 bacterium TaxID=2053526 RepID=A0A7X9DKL6_UNCKA|nr:ribonuclease J [candidate division WWE3 bacterium]
MFTIYDEQKYPNKMTPLKIIKMGSDVGATKNMVVYESGDDIIIVDCGVGFPDGETLGVDVVIPDITYLLENREKVRGIFVTHVHEDHFGAIPYIIEDLPVPIYTNRIAIEFIKERIKDKGVKNPDAVKFNLITPETPEVILGNFKIKAIGINHSVPSPMGFAITTPQGTILHMADYKIDWTPVLDKPIELGKIANYGDAGVLCLLSDCLGVTADGYTKSERTLDESFDHFIGNAAGRQLFVTTISSNVSRMYQIINAARKHGRKVVFSGRSIDQSSQIARELGFLPFDSDTFVPEKEAKDHTQDSLVYIIAGCYGQTGSGLYRLSIGEHNNITLEPNALVIFSADPFPGVEENVERLLHNLTVSGAEVLYSEIQDNLHVSGHGLKGDLATVSALSKAKFYIPIGGTAAKMRAYTNMVKELGVTKDRVFELLEGQTLIFDEAGARLGDRLELKQVYIDGRNNDTLSPIVVKDREQLSTEGVFVVFVPQTQNGNILSDKIDVVTRGFIYVKGSQELMDESRKYVTKTLNKLMAKNKEPAALKKKCERELADFLYKKTGRTPLVIVHNVQI